MKTKALCVIIVFAAFAMAAYADPFQTGGDRLIATQNTDGGWGWPLTGVSATNTVGPIGMGLLSAYRMTGDTDHYDALVDAAEYLRVNTPPHATGNGIFMYNMSQLTGDPKWAADVKTEFYDALAAGTYVRVGTGDTTLYNTSTYVQRLLSVRGNMAPWDIGLATVGSYLLDGTQTSAWIQGVKDGISQLTKASYYHVLGLAGGVFALGATGTEFDPTVGDYAAASNVKGLADLLAGNQLSSGGFTWWDGAMDPGYEAIQETAYSILALNAVDRSGYWSNISGAGAYLRSVQLTTGGWEGYVGSGENNEVTGEALWGAAVATPEPFSMAFLGTAFFGMVGYRLRARRKQAGK